MQHEVLILTDHTHHSAENSLYELAVKMLLHPLTASVDIASRANSENEPFFSSSSGSSLYATSIVEHFSFFKSEHPLSRDFREIDLQSYDLVWLRIPPPLSRDFLSFIDSIFSDAVIINNPKSIYETGSKAFLTNFPSVCPPMKICSSLEDIIEFKVQVGSR